MQHILGSNLKFTNFLSINPVEDATTKDVYDEQYVFNNLSEQAELNMKYGSLCVDQSRSAPERNKTKETKTITNQNSVEHSRTTET